MSDTGEEILISGGTITVNANGDGIDSNGSLEISGGTITVWGPTASDNGALDANGTMTISGGTLLAVGSSGMAEGPDSSSSQSWLMAQVSASSGDSVTISDASGTEIATFTAEKDFSTLVYSASGISSGDEYTVATGSSSVTVTAGESSSGGMGGQGGNRQQNGWG